MTDTSATNTDEPGHDWVRSSWESTTSTLIHIESDPLPPGPDGGGWWDVPVAETSVTPSVQRARTEYDRTRAAAATARLR